VWEGVLHLNSALHSQHGRLEWQLAGILGPLAAAVGLQALGQFNLGEEGDCRVPDGALGRPGPDAVYVATAALVLEIVSPGDESWEKLGFSAAHEVDEVLIVDPQEKAVSWMGIERGEYHHLKRSRLIELGAAELAEQIDWPQPGEPACSTSNGIQSRARPGRRAQILTRRARSAARARS
jgi:hypothetical protein